MRVIIIFFHSICIYTIYVLTTFKQIITMKRVNEAVESTLINNSITGIYAMENMDPNFN